MRNVAFFLSHEPKNARETCLNRPVLGGLPEPLGQRLSDACGREAVALLLCGGQDEMYAFGHGSAQHMKYHHTHPACTLVEVAGKVKGPGGGWCRRGECRGAGGARVRVFLTGATGLVGRELLSLLEERRFPVVRPSGEYVEHQPMTPRW